MYHIPFIIIFVILSILAIQGWMIMNARCGYTKSPKVKHPEMNDVRAGDTLMSIKFSDEDLEKLQRRVIQQKMNELFEEPSSYEDEDDDDVPVF